MVIGTLADSVLRRVEAVGDAVSETLFEPVVRLGVTGLARSGKTVFITSLVANLLDRGRMHGLTAARDARIEAAFLQPQPDDTVPRFAYEDHIGALTGPNPHWPDSTRAVSELRLSLRVRPSGLLSGLKGPRTVHLDIVDYPGEWLMDLGLLDKSYDDWAGDVLSRIDKRACAQGFMARARAVDPEAKHDEPQAQDLAKRFTSYLRNARKQGYSDCTPGRFLLPGDLAGSPVLTFAPIPYDKPSKRRSLHREMERRFGAYKGQGGRPFFLDPFVRLGRGGGLSAGMGANPQG
ncbi:MAG: YcjX family protein, partial [Paracoccaceae bacterium]